MMIETPRLILRQPVISDLEKIHTAKIGMWDELQKWMSWAFDDQIGIDSTRAFIENYGDGSGNLEAIAGFEKDTGEFVISTGINPHAKENEYSTGYWVAKPMLGKGYATEATNAMIRYIFGTLKAKAVHIDYYEGNDNSANVIRKLGFENLRVDAKAKARCSNGELLNIHRHIMKDVSKLPPLEVSWK